LHFLGLAFFYIKDVFGIGYIIVMCVSQESPSPHRFCAITVPNTPADQIAKQHEKVEIYEQRMAERRKRM